MKEDNILVQAALYAYPEYEREIRRCKTKIDYLTGLKYSSADESGTCATFAKIAETIREKENYELLQNVVMTAVSSLDDYEKQIITLTYHKKLRLKKVSAILDVKESTLKYYRHKSLVHIQDVMRILGMDNAKMIELFDDSALLIRWASVVKMQRQRKVVIAYGEDDDDWFCDAICDFYDEEGGLYE